MATPGPVAYSVLVVDDEEGLRSLLTHRLKQEDFAVETASDGEEALEILTESGGTFDALILDLSMPKMGGFELLRRIDDLGIDPLTIVLSGRVDEEQQLRAFELGAVDFVEKPFSPAVLATRLRKNLDRET